ncbi:MAG: hypothetical protein BGO29_14885 [Bacteroidales bacterium 36-12]|nr:MAG: hypothetical protein BGO29_14885 [Bacteroidales bacterium 36-12]
MEELEKLLAEYKIRFRDTDKFIGMSPDEYPFNIQLGERNIWNRHGRVYNIGVWQIADIKEAPEKWVVKNEKDSPFWETFRYWLDNKNYSVALISSGTFYISHVLFTSFTLLDFSDHQLLTLEQWHKLIYLPEKNEPKVGDWGIFYNNKEDMDDIVSHLGVLHKIIDNNYWKKQGVVNWEHFYKIDPNMSLNEIIEDFKKNAK